MCQKMDKNKFGHIARKDDTTTTGIPRVMLKVIM